MNKKKLFGSIAILSIAAMTAFNVNVNSKEKGLSDVSLANVEALASNERPTTEDCKEWCKTNYDWDCILVTNFGNEWKCENSRPI